MTPQSEKESNIKQLGRLPYGGCPKALPFCLLVTEAVPQPFRKALAFLVVLVAQRRIKFPQLILLGLGHALGHFHHHTHILVAAAAAIQGRDALIPQTEYRPALGALRHMVAHFAIYGGDYNVITHSRLGKGNGDLAPDIIAVTLKERIGPDADCHPQITGGTAVAAAIALAAHRYGLAVINAGRDIDGHGLADLDTALAAALGAGLLDDATPSAAAGAGLLHLHYTDGGLTPHSHLAGAVAIGAGFGAGTLLGAAAAAFTAVFQAGDLNIPGAALYRLHKGDGNLRFPVLAADGPIGVPYPAAAKAAKAASA